MSHVPPPYPQAAPPGWYPDPEYPGYQRYWDGVLWTVRRPVPPAVAPAAPPAHPPAYPAARPWTRPVGPRFGVLAGFVQAGLLLAVLALVAEIAVQVWGIAMVPEALRVLDVDRLTRYDDLNVAAVACYVVAWCVTGVLWSIWQYQVARVARVGEIARSPGQHAGFWYIPFANAALGPMNVKNLWERFVGPRTALVVWWWVLMFVPLLLLNGVPDEPRNAAELRTGMGLRLVVALCQAAAGVMALQIVRTLTVAARRRSEALVSPGGPPPA